MTTVAYRDGVMAADGRGNVNGRIVSSVDVKIRRLSDGSLATGCGSSAIIATYLKWLEDRSTPRPSLMSVVDKEDGATVFVVRKDGRIERHEPDGIEVEPEDLPFFSCGSGAMAALAAMHMGAGSKRAVEIACLCDVYSGGRIITMTIDGEDERSPEPCPQI